MNDIKDQAKNVVDEGKKVLHEVFENDNMRKHMKKAVEEAKDTIEASKEAAKDVVYVIKDKATNFNSLLCDCISKNPWATIGIAAGIGWLIGKLGNNK